MNLVKAACMRSVVTAAVALMLSTAFVGPARAIPALLAASEDQGPVSSEQLLHATVWLKKTDQAAFDARVALLYDRSSPSYHQWLTPAQLAAYNAGPESLAKVKAQLLASGLRVVAVSEDGTAVRVEGSAAVVQKAFGTSIHAFSHAGKAFLAATTPPRIRGDAAELVSRVTGLTTKTFAPMFSRAIDVNTGASRASIALNASSTTSVLDNFTTQCFLEAENFHIHNGAVNGAVGADVYFSGRKYSVRTSRNGQRICGYTPAQVLKHYGLDAAAQLGLNGSGQTIVIVDAYGSPNLAADVATFSSLVGVQAMSTSQLKIVYPDGKPQTTNEGWATETTLDVEWAHAIAPRANIVLAVAPTDENDDLEDTLRYAVVNRLGNVISNSYGSPEGLTDPMDLTTFASIIQTAASLGISVDVSSGDSQDNGVGTPIGASNAPADAPYATSVGGTSLGIPSAVGPTETGWGTTSNFIGSFFSCYAFELQQGGSGGGESTVFAKPAYQKQLPGVGRQQPDISAIADPYTGGLLVFTPPATGSTQQIGSIGGTSLASPIFSAVWSMADQLAGKPLGQAAPLVSEMPDWAVTDMLPLQSPPEVTGTYTPFFTTEVLPLQPTSVVTLPATATDFASFFANESAGTSAVAEQLYGFAFGYDASLTVTKGWDNVTGYGTPRGLGFIAAAALEGYGVTPPRNLEQTTSLLSEQLRD